METTFSDFEFDFEEDFDDSTILPQPSTTDWNNNQPTTSFDQLNNNFPLPTQSNNFPSPTQHTSHHHHHQQQQNHHHHHHQQQQKPQSQHHQPQQSHHHHHNFAPPPPQSLNTFSSSSSFAPPTSKPPPFEVYASLEVHGLQKRTPPRKSYLDGHPGQQIIEYHQQQQEEQRDAIKPPTFTIYGKRKRQVGATPVEHVPSSTSINTQQQQHKQQQQPFQQQQQQIKVQTSLQHLVPILVLENNFLTCYQKSNVQVDILSPTFGCYWRNRNNNLCGFPSIIQSEQQQQQQEQQEQQEQQGNPGNENGLSQKQEYAFVAGKRLKVEMEMIATAKREAAASSSSSSSLITQPKIQIKVQKRSLLVTFPAESAGLRLKVKFPAAVFGGSTTNPTNANTLPQRLILVVDIISVTLPETEDANQVTQATYTSQHLHSLQGSSIVATKDIQWQALCQGMDGAVEMVVRLMPKTWKYNGPVTKMHGKEKMTYRPVDSKEKVSSYLEKCLLCCRVSTFLRKEIGDVYECLSVVRSKGFVVGSTRQLRRSQTAALEKEQEHAAKMMSTVASQQYHSQQHQQHHQQQQQQLQQQQQQQQEEEEQTKQIQGKE